MVEWCITRPVAVSLLTLGILLSGILAFFGMPVSPLPRIEYPTISVTANLPGASPEVVSSTLSAPLERTLGNIAGVTEITSSSSQGRSRITLQFDLDRSIETASRDVQAAINASLPLLPPGLPSLPTYRKVNPAEAPILIIALTSDVLDRGQLYDVASTVLAQRLAQVSGVGQVDIAGGALPAVRVQVNPTRTFSLGLTLEDIRKRISESNLNRPKGLLESDGQSWLVAANDQLRSAQQYRRILIRYVDNKPVYLGDLADVTDSVQDTRHFGAANGSPAIVLVISKQPGANIIETVDRIRGILPALQAQIPGAMKLTTTLDRTTTIRASLHEVQRSLILSVALVLAVVLVFLRRLRSALIPGVCVPVALLGTCAAMYLLGFSIDNLSLMALTMATGFVVDDAIVVLENIARHRHKGLGARAAAVQATREIAPTLVSMTVALLAVFIPVLLMGGIVGRLFHEFAIILCCAVCISMLVSLTVAPSLSTSLMQDRSPDSSATPAGRMRMAVGTVLARAGRWCLRRYRNSLSVCLRHPAWVMAFFVAVLACNAYLYMHIPKGFFPQQDTGRISGNFQGDQSASFQFMQQRLKTFIDVIGKDPAVAAVSGFTGGGQRNYGSLFLVLKPLSDRKESAEVVIARLRKQLGKVPGARVFFSAQQDIRVGARQSNSQFEYSLRSDDLQLLQAWEPRIRFALQQLPELTDVSSDQQNKALQTYLTVDRDALAVAQLTMRDVDNHLYDAFGQRQVSVIYNPLNQYRVVLEIDPAYLQGPEGLDVMRLPAPLQHLATPSLVNAPLSVAHESGSPSLTFSFALPIGVALSDARLAIEAAMNSLGVPSAIRGSFQGTAKALGDSERSQPLLVLAAVLVIYLVLGILYESLMHPLTILSTLPSAGIGALLALHVVGAEFTVIALIGVTLLMGIVMKNAILMVDFALQHLRRGSGMTPEAAILRAASQRVRPILMTTIASALGALPLAMGTGDGAELRQPLGIALVGGLLMSQWLTLYTTPVVFVLLDRLRQWRPHGRRVALASAAVGATMGLGGCSIAPAVLPAVVQSNEVFRNAPAWVSTAQIQGSEQTVAWWQGFGDAGLDELQAQVARGNVALAVNAAQVAVAQAAFEASRAALFPSFNVTGGLVRSANSFSNPRGTSYSVSGVFSPWELDLWGRLSGQADAAQANVQATRYTQMAAQLSVHSQVTQTWLSWRFAQTQAALLERSAKLSQRLLAVANNRQQAGVASALDVSQAQAQLSSVQAQAVASRAQARTLLNALATLCGMPASRFDEGILSPGGDSEQPAGTGAVVLGGYPQRLPVAPMFLPSSLVARRADILSAAAAVTAANAQLGVTQAALFPVLTLSASGGYRAPSTAALFDMPSKVWSLGPSLAYAVFDGGLRQAQRRGAMANLELQTAQYRQIVLTALQEVEDQLVATAQYAEQGRLQSEALTAADKALEVVNNQYLAGTASAQALITAQQTQLAAQVALLSARHQQALAVNVLLKNVAGAVAP